jgi:hypothetical protein
MAGKQTFLTVSLFASTLGQEVWASESSQLRLAQNCPGLQICANTQSQCSGACSNMQQNTINGDSHARLRQCIDNCRSRYMACYDR